MDKGTEQTFHQRRQTNGGQIFEKKCKVTNHQGNANQNHSETQPHICWDGYKRQAMTSGSEDAWEQW